jgi:hypothetical protein
MHYEEPEVDELDPADADIDHEVAAEIEAEANLEADAEAALISDLEDNTFNCAECNNNFSIEDSTIFGYRWICTDCLPMVEHLERAQE